MATRGSYEKLLASPSRSGGDLSSDRSDGSYSLFNSGAVRTEDQPSPMSLSDWIHNPEASPGYVEYLMKNLEMVPSPEMVQLIGSPAGTGSEHGYGAAYSSETPHDYLEFLSESLAQAPHTGKPGMIGSSATASHAYEAVSETGRKLWRDDAPKPRSSQNVQDFSDKRTGKLIPSTYAGKSLGYEASATVTNQKPCFGGEHMNRSTSSKVETGRHAKKYLLWGSEEDRKDYSPFQPHPHETSVAPYSLSRPHLSEANRKDFSVLQLHPDETGATTVKQRDMALTNDRLRRLRVSESLKELQGLVPNSSPVKGGQTFIVDGIIDYVKYLQFQLKELCRSRLRSEPTSSPFIFVEGYGHYALHGQMMSEPLEEVIGVLLETNPSAATQILAARGIYLVPQSFAGGSPRIA